MLHYNVFYRVMQQTLQKAYPSGLPSNQVLNQFSNPYDQINVPDEVIARVTQTGYPYGWGEFINTPSSGTYNITEPMSQAWIVRLTAQKPTNTGVTLSAAIGGGTSQTLTRVDPAQIDMYADNMFPWSPAYPLGRVGMQPWGTPSDYVGLDTLWPILAPDANDVTVWPDSTAQWMGPISAAASSAQVGQWLLKKWVYFSSNTAYTVSLAADSIANLFIDGELVIEGATVYSPLSVNVNLTTGWHLVTVSCINQGSTPKQTGVLLSIADSSGNIVENGSYHHAIGTQWQTSGFINPTWTTVSTEDDMMYSWYVIPASQISSETIALTVSTSASPSGQAPTPYGVWWYSVPAWRWDEGGEYDQTKSTNTPAQVTPMVETEVVG